MSVVLKRLGKLVTVGIASPGSMDEQFKPVYDAPVNVQARVVKETKVVPNASGDEVRTTWSVWVEGEQPKQPAENDRITLVDGTPLIVVVTKEGLTVQNVLDHTKAMCREE